MKRKFSILFAALAAILLITPPHFITKAQGQATTGTILWEETWTGGTSGETPSNYGFEGTTVYNQQTLNYLQSSNSTKLYNENYAEGTAPELLLSKSNQTWTIENIPTGQATIMTLTFLSNKTSFSVTSSTTGISIKGSAKEWEISAESNITSFNLTIKNTSPSNARIDNIKLTVKTPSSSPTITLSPTELSDFSYSVGQGPSVADSLTLQGSNLTEGVTLSATEYYEISKTSEGEYSASLTYTTDEIAEAQTVYVRLKAGLQAGNYRGTITASSTGADNKTITLSGEVYQEFHLTFSAENGSVSATANGEDIKSGDPVAAGTTVTLTATANEGYRFSSWTVEPSADLDGNPVNFTMPENDVHITANFEQRTTKTVTLHHGIGGNTTTPVTKYDDSTLGEFVKEKQAESVNGWSFAGWVKGYTSGTPSYINETEIVGQTTDLYALYSKGTNTFELINDVEALEVGGVYMICGEYNNSFYCMSEPTGNYMGATEGNTVENNQFEYNVGKKFVLGGESDAYTFADGDNYLSATEGKNYLGFSQELTDFSKWSISFSSSVANISNVGNDSNTNKIISYYNQKFNCYNKPNTLYLYKQITDKEYSITPNAEKCHVTYYANGGSNPPTDNNEYEIGETVTVLGPGEMSREGHTFMWWSNMQNWEDNGAEIYGEGETFTISENTTLYAQWTTNSYSFVLNTSGNVLASLYVDGTKLQDNDKIQFDKEVTVEVAVNPGYIYTVSVTNNNTQELVQVTNDKFTMPASDITVTVTERVNPFICATLDSEKMMQFIPNTEKAYGYGYIKHVTSDGLLWVTNGFFQTKSNTISLGMIQIRERDNSGGVSYIKLPEFEGRIEKIVFSVTSASAITSNGETTPNKLYFQETATKDGEIIAQGGGDNTNSITISLSDKVYNTGYILASKSIRIWNIEVTYTPYNNFIQYDDNTPLPSEIPAGDNISISNNANMEV